MHLLHIPLHGRGIEQNTRRLRRREHWAAGGAIDFRRERVPQPRSQADL
uniref:Callose synthase 12-like n=1 Tax=Rhizophora mucronata TaxID=61149 RepID=A0A2P2P1R7_RHIMU